MKHQTDMHRCGQPQARKRDTRASPTGGSGELVLLPVVGSIDREGGVPLAPSARDAAQIIPDRAQVAADGVSRIVCGMRI
jgi:hypothetical protein